MGLAHHVAHVQQRLLQVPLNETRFAEDRGGRQGRRCRVTRRHPQRLLGQRRSALGVPLIDRQLGTQGGKFSAQRLPLRQVQLSFDPADHAGRDIELELGMGHPAIKQRQLGALAELRLAQPLQPSGQQCVGAFGEQCRPLRDE